MDTSLGCSQKALAICGLAAYSATVVFIALTLKFPRFGASPVASGESLRLPPQALLAGMIGVFTLGAAVLLGIECIRHSIENRRWTWLPVFPTFILAGLLGPALLVLQPHLSTATWNFIALISALGVLCTLLSGLVYSLRSPPG
jgi:hypothetical protein